MPYRRSSRANTLGLLAAGLLGLLAGGCGGSSNVRTSGLELYANNCAACHGDHAEGDGPVASALAVQVPNLRTLSERNGGTFPTASVAAYIDGRTPAAAHGARLMPVWGDEFTVAAGAREPEVQSKIAALVAFLAALQY
jgi:mono/diheme cytochrome c family protein